MSQQDVPLPPQESNSLNRVSPDGILVETTQSANVASIQYIGIQNNYFRQGDGQS